MLAKPLKAFASKSFGGAKGCQTPDLYNANVASSQLCYDPML